MVPKHFVGGELDGLWTVWYEHGQKKRERSFVDGELEGRYTEWYENGQKKDDAILSMAKYMAQPASGTRTAKKYPKVTMSMVS